MICHISHLAFLHQSLCNSRMLSSRTGTNRQEKTSTVRLSGNIPRQLNQETASTYRFSILQDASLVSERFAVVRVVH